MNVWDFIAHTFNGNETARSMRYSLSLIVILLIATYLGVVEQNFTQSLILTAAGYIFGRSRNQTHVVDVKDRRSDDITSISTHS